MAGSDHEPVDKPTTPRGAFSNLPRVVRLSRQQLGEQLISRGVISELQLRQALEQQKNDPGELLGNVLVRLGMVPRLTMARILEEVTGSPFVDLTQVETDPEVVRLLPEQMVRQRQILPVRTEGNSVWLAMVDPMDLDALDAARLMLRRPIQQVLVLSLDLMPVINKVFDVRERAEQALKELEDQEGEAESEDGGLSQIDEVPIIRLVNSILDAAFVNGASDIHLEPQARDLRVRFRVDGLMYEQMVIPRANRDAAISRIKVISGMDIAERRRPQDGRITRNFQHATFDLRVSTLPTVNGEKVVMRILDKSAMSATLEKIGFLPDELEEWRKLIVKPYGILLVTGPTGSGKSTTLYASLNQINDPAKNISTVEDPVEYQLPGINQTQVNIRAGITFASGLRTLMRQDPDIILVGEVRDLETAEVAINAALTGHLVFATLHTNDAPGAVVRLNNMGIEPFLIASSVLGIVGQRLVRRICENCKEWYEPDADLRDSLGIQQVREPGEEEPIRFARGVGCSECHFKGYRGRVAVFEILSVSETIRAMILRQEPSSAIREQAITDGMRPMRLSALRKVLMGITTPEEVARVLLDDTE
ncbi:MAG: GspE/PulE family protein [Armatimonas sp.]